jgi:hypothetical protein
MTIQPINKRDIHKVYGGQGLGRGELIIEFVQRHNKRTKQKRRQLKNSFLNRLLSTQ